jgi:hypothetical protein
MMALKNFTLLAGVLVLADLAPSHAQIGPVKLPPEVMEFVGRRASCLDWSQKVTDRQHAAQVDSIVSIMRSLKCSDIANDERALRQRYVSNPDVLSAIDDTWVKVVKRVPIRTAPGTLPSDLDH